ncbi:hypothetical protein HMPREF9349_04426 [Escherichia coli MS 79-10]|nr:hypothetical protein HMPREF9345_03240 [Escherichia coli MS 107-1]EGU95676.1 hypothetical protein HMPREF9349_04426 [Escherichia coli MS 79-10]
MTIGGYLRKILMKRVVLMNFFCRYRCDTAFALHLQRIDSTSHYH